MRCRLIVKDAVRVKALERAPHLLGARLDLWSQFVSPGVFRSSSYVARSTQLLPELQYASGPAFLVPPASAGPHNYSA